MWSGSGSPNSWLKIHVYPDSWLRNPSADRWRNGGFVSCGLFQMCTRQGTCVHPRGPGRHIGCKCDFGHRWGFSYNYIKFKLFVGFGSVPTWIYLYLFKLLNANSDQAFENCTLYLKKLNLEKKFHTNSCFIFCFVFSWEEIGNYKVLIAIKLFALVL